MLSEEKLLAAACTVHDYQAYRDLEVRQPGWRDQVPDREYFRSVFTFSQGSLLRYIESHPGLAQKLLESRKTSARRPRHT